MIGAMARILGEPSEIGKQGWPTDQGTSGPDRSSDRKVFSGRHGPLICDAQGWIGRDWIVQDQTAYGFFKHNPTAAPAHLAPSGAPPLGQNTDISVSLASQLTAPSAACTVRRLAVAGSPLSPFSPLSPLSPLSPFAPGVSCGPCAPFAPAGACVPATP